MIHRTPCLSLTVALVTVAAFSMAPAAFGADQPAGVQAAAARSTDPGVQAPNSSPELLKELQQRLNNKTLRELRTTYNGDYGTTLLMANDEVVCYVALLYKRDFWRVYRFDALAPAERAYIQMARQSAAWSEDDIRKQVLASQKGELERSVRASEERARALGEEMNVARIQRERILQEQQAARAEAQATEVEGRALRIQLNQLQQQIRQLESELSRVEGVDSPNTTRPRPRTSP